MAATVTDSVVLQTRHSVHTPFADTCLKNFNYIPNMRSICTFIVISLAALAIAVSVRYIFQCYATRPGLSY